MGVKSKYRDALRKIVELDKMAYITPNYAIREAVRIASEALAGEASEGRQMGGNFRAYIAICPKCDARAGEYHSCEEKLGERQR